MDWIEEVRTMPDFELETIDSYHALADGNCINVELFRAEAQERME